VRIKLDENLPSELGDLLGDRGHDVRTVSEESLVGQDDAVIFAAATREGRMLLTLDLDFSDVRRYEPGTHPGIVLFRLREPSRRRILERTRQVLDLSPIDAWARCFVVVSDRKLRVRKP
jgi:predicted nuclease of predicted toxin-antitoxin system